MKTKNLVVYLFTKYDDDTSLLNFIRNYTQHPAGKIHKLLICFKLIDKKKILLLESFLKKINYIKFIDPYKYNDFDFGSYKRVALLYPKYNILFLNSHSYPNTDMWLNKLLKYFDDKTLIATSASYESLYTSLRLKKFYKIFSYLKKKLDYKNKFYPFPNPHIRTANFLIKGLDFLKFIKNKEINNKFDAWQIESGKNSLTDFFKLKNYKIFIVNSDGDRFTLNNCKFSETFNYRNQKKCIISDKHTRKYIKSTNFEKKLYEFNTWGEKS
jgi:hypothetical protein